MGLDEVAQPTTSFEQVSTVLILYTADSLEVKSNFPKVVWLYTESQRDQFRGWSGRTSSIAHRTRCSSHD